MLGHKSLDTTQVYTHVSIRKLQQVHDQTHPAKNERPKPDEALKPSENASPENALPENASPETPPKPPKTE